MNRPKYRYTLGLIMVLTALISLSCSQNTRNDWVGQVAVRGEAELEVDPDKMIFEVYLRQYYLEELENYQEGRQLRTLSEDVLSMERTLLTALAAMQVPSEDIVLTNAGSTTAYWGNVRGPQNLAFRSYQVTLRNLEQREQMLALPMSYGSYVRLNRLEYEDLDSIKLQAKQLAVANAHLRAQNLSQGYGKVVGIIFMSEDDSRITNQQGSTGFLKTGAAPAMMENNSLRMDSVANDEGAAAVSSVAWRKIKVWAGVDVVFAVR